MRFFWTGDLHPADEQRPYNGVILNIPGIHKVLSKYEFSTLIKLNPNTGHGPESLFPYGLYSCYPDISWGL